MKIKFAFMIIILLFITGQLFAKKEAQVDSTKYYVWIPTAIGGINISQISLSNWAQGGENSLAWTLMGNLGLTYINDNWTFHNNFKFAFGRTKLGGQNFRTNENELYFESVLSLHLGWAADPYLSNTINTAITKGYNFKKDPPQEIANFFDPGYITQSLGFTYDKLLGFKTRLGFAVQETFTNKYRQYSDDLTTKERQEAFKIETGIESVTAGEFHFDGNLIIKSSLRLFTRYEHLDVWDIRWDSALIAKINNYINVNFGVLVIYEKKQSLKTQLKEGLQLGFTYTFL